MLCGFRLKVVWNSFVLISCLRSFVLPSLCDVKNYKGQGQTFVLPTYDLKECHQKWPHQILETQWRLTLNAQSKWSNQRLGNRPLGWKWRRDTYNMTLHQPESCTQKWSFFHRGPPNFSGVRTVDFSIPDTIKSYLQLLLDVADNFLLFSSISFYELQIVNVAEKIP